MRFAIREPCCVFEKAPEFLGVDGRASATASRQRALVATERFAPWVVIDARARGYRERVLVLVIRHARVALQELFPN